MAIKANITFTHTDDPPRKGVEFDVLPREGEDLAVAASGSSGHKRIDRVVRVRHFITDTGQGIEILVGRR